MSVHSVTARSHVRRLTPANLPRQPTSSRVVAIRKVRQVRTRIPASVSTRGVIKSAASKVALRKLAHRLLGPLAIVSPVIAQIGEQIYRKHIDPSGFPGWGSFPDGWTSNPGTPFPGASPGDYTANGFDNGPYSSSAKNIIDTSDGTPITGFRYWGHFEAGNPLPGGRPGDDWEIVTRIMPGVQSAVGAQPLYRQLRNLAQEPMARWSPSSAISITLNIGPSGRLATDLKFQNNPPRSRDGQSKAKPKNVFIFFALKKLANAGGETKEWVDIFAQAAGYDDFVLRQRAGFERLGGPVPEDIDDGKHETQKKIYYLFWMDGINAVDFDELWELARENVVEDIAYGALGQLSRSAAQNLGLTVGPQTGLVL